MLPLHPIKRRRKRYDIPGQAHYLTFSCWRNQPLLARDRPRTWLLESLEVARRVHPFGRNMVILRNDHASHPRPDRPGAQR